MPLWKRECTPRLGLVLVAVMLAGCGQGGEREARTAAAPVRRVIDELSVHPHWQAGRCLCVGFSTGETVGDFPAGVLDDELARHPWVRRWTECAPLYGRKHGLAECRVSMTDYVCSVVDRPGLPEGTSRVMCHVNGDWELLADEFDVSRDDSGAFRVKPVSSNASRKLHE